MSMEPSEKLLEIGNKAHCETREIITRMTKQSDKQIAYVSKNNQKLVYDNDEEIKKIRTYHKTVFPQ